MRPTFQPERSLRAPAGEGSRAIPALVLVAALGVLATAVSLGALSLRGQIRTRMLERDGEILQAVTRTRAGAESPLGDLPGRLREPAGQLALALELSTLTEGVLGVRLFDASGHGVTAFPPYVPDASLTQAETEGLSAGHAVTRYDPVASLNEVAGLAPGTTPDATLPLLLVTVPISNPAGGGLLASAQLIVDGHALAASFSRLDRNLALDAGALFVATGTLLSLALVWGYARLQRTNQSLRERTGLLLQANHELAMAGKTRAVGAVAAHLVHGLSNPLASLQQFVSTHAGGRRDDPEWQEALSTARRAQNLVDEAVRVLGEEGGGQDYELSLTELGDLLRSRLRPEAALHGVQLEVQVEGTDTIANRHANLVLLVLESLGQNALQVTPRGRNVTISLTQEGGTGMVWEVRDQGPGFPPALLPRLFSPCPSTKGGNGIGLAISRQLSRHLGGELTLDRTGPEGCCFALRLPARLEANSTPPQLGDPR